MAVTKSEVWEKLCLQLVHSFHGFEKVDEEFKEVFSNLVNFSEKLALDLKKDKFLGLLVMQPEELVAQRKDEETRGRSNQKTKDSQCRKWQGDVLYLRRHHYILSHRT